MQCGTSAGVVTHLQVTHEGQVSCRRLRAGTVCADGQERGAIVQILIRSKQYKPADEQAGRFCYWVCTPCLLFHCRPVRVSALLLLGMYAVLAFFHRRPVRVSDADLALHTTKFRLVWSAIDGARFWLADLCAE